MEHCNTSLRQLIENTSYFPETQLKTILRDVASGLKVLHLKNVVHLDIKPENILFSQSNKYKIADLGLSRIAISVKGEDIIEGDSRYLAPELLNEVQEDYLPDLKKADIFSLGVTFYELITRRTIPNNGEEWHMIRSGKLVGLETEISGKIKEIVRRMVHPKPEMRPSAEEVLNCEFLKEDSEAEIRWEIMENEVLRSRIKEYERLLGIKRKKSI
jgi:wee1-like protein kinase